MSRYYIKTICLRDITLLFLPYLLDIFFVSGGNMIKSLTFVHYTYYGINTCYIIFCYIKINELNKIRHLLLPRMGKDKFQTNTVIITISLTIAFLLFQYLFMWVLSGGIPAGFESYFLIFTICYGLMFLFCAFVLCLQVANKQNLAYLVIPVAINLLFHYVLIPMCFSY